MTKFKKKWSAIPIAGVLALTGAAAGVDYCIRQPQNAIVLAEAAWSDAQISDSYTIGTEFEVPVRTLTENDETVTATSVIILPDGTATRKTKIKLDLGGKYTVRYTAVCDGKPYLDEVTFDVARSMFSVSSSKSSFKYGLYDSIAAGTTKAVTKPGVLVSLAEGDKFTVEQLIDVRDLTKKDVLIEAFATPVKMGSPDFKNLVFTLTDANDPDVYLKISSRHSAESDSKTASYYLAGGNGQVLAGYEKDWDRIHINNSWGAWAYHTFTGKFEDPKYEVALDTMPMSLRYDVGELAAYTGNTMIIDFDNPKFFTNLWQGFSSGYAKLSIQAGSYINTTAEFCLSEVRGVDLTAKTYSPDKPVITVDVDDERNMPSAQKGGYYPVPNATAFDNYCGSSDVEVSVYYNYLSDAKVKLPVENGKFKTELDGDYAIVYETVNTNGDRAKKVITVRTASDIPPITVANENIGKVMSDVTLGTYLEIGDITAAGGSGKLTVKTEVVHNGKTTEIKDGFRLEESGDHVIRITATDYIGNSKSAEFTVKTKAGGTLFVDEPTLPDYFICGGTYIIPELYANDYSSGALERKLASVEIDGKTYAAGDEYLPQVKNNGDIITVTFKSGSAEKTVAVKAVKAFVQNGLYEDLHMENYIVGDGVSVSATEENLSIAATQPNGKFTFANSLLAENFDLQLIGDKANSTFKGLNIYLTDSIDRNVRVLIKLTNTGTTAGVQINDTKIDLSYSFADGGIFNIGFTKTDAVIGGSPIAVKRCENGDKFTGFPSGKVMLEIVFDGALTGAAYNLCRINGQMMSNAVEDRIGPKISLMDKDYGGSISIGTEKELPYAMAGDTLDPYVSFSLTVTAPDGTPVTDVNGKLLKDVDPTAKYTIKFDKYGQYRVAYKATDSFAAVTSQWSYMWVVEDEFAPTIEFKHPIAETAKVGDILIIPDFTVSDNVSAVENITVLKSILNPNGELIKLEDGGNSLKAAYVGVYEIRILVIDEEGNVTTVRKNIAVTE